MLTLQSLTRAAPALAHRGPYLKHPADDWMAMPRLRMLIVLVELWIFGVVVLVLDRPIHLLAQQCQQVIT